MDEIKVEDAQCNQRIPTDNAPFVLYKRRWYILLTLVILIGSNTLQWLAFAPIAYNAAQFYEKDVAVINLLSLVFMVVAIPCGIIATWLLDTFGLRLSIIVSAWLNFVGSVIRIISALPGIAVSVKVPLVFLGSVIAALAQPLTAFAPTKLAARWFPENQRAMANTIATMSSTVAMMLAGILSPILVPDKDHILFMLCILSIPAVTAVAMATTGVCSSEPPTPPSPSAESPSQPFCVGVKALLRNKRYWLLAWSIGGGIGFISVLTTLLSQILCPWGYDNDFVGIVCIVSLFGAGLIGSVILSVVVDNTKKYTEVTKVCYTVACMAIIAFVVLHRYGNQAVPIAILFAVIGLFGLPVYPIGNELAVETTYPVGEATSSGILFMSSQVQAVLLILILSAFAKELPSDFPGQVCNTGNDPNVKVYDMTICTYVLAGYTCFQILAFVLTFRTRYKRVETEKRKANAYQNSVKETQTGTLHDKRVAASTMKGTASYLAGQMATV